MANIRDATPEDAGVLFGFACQLRAAPEGTGRPVAMTAERLRADLGGAAPKVRGLIAEEDGAVAGGALYSFVHFSLSGEHLYIDDLYVAPGQRGRGLGGHLMSELAGRAKARGCVGMTWFVERDNRAAIRFYERLGASVSESRLIMGCRDLDTLIEAPAGSLVPGGR